MNKNQKEKTVQILIRANPKDKEKIKSMAKKCNLSVKEYMLQRALGYEPKALLPESFYRTIHSQSYRKKSGGCNAL